MHGDNPGMLRDCVQRAVRWIMLVCPLWFCGKAAAAPVAEAWRMRVSALRWVAYFPTNSNPKQGAEPTRPSIQADLAVLRQAKFDGLVTYGCSGIVGRELPELAQAAGFQGLIVGIWDPKNAAEIVAAGNAAKNGIVLGLCVGNEGLNERYNLKELSSAIQSLRETTGKPVTTAEQIEDYSDDSLLRLGDWVFPNAHPYFHRELDPANAVQWTANAYSRLARRTDRFVLFKEVGLPSAGKGKENVSEENQDAYYAKLADTAVRFVYFEAFDQPWKDHLPVEPNWGIFKADRTPKRLGSRLMRPDATRAVSPK